MMRNLHKEIRGEAKPMKHKEHIRIREAVAQLEVDIRRMESELAALVERNRSMSEEIESVHTHNEMAILEREANSLLLLAVSDHMNHLHTLYNRLEEQDREHARILAETLAKSDRLRQVMRTASGLIRGAIEEAEEETEGAAHE